MQCWHLTLSSIERLPLFPGEGARRRAVRSLVRVLGHRLVLFCAADDHLHVVVVCPAAAVPRLCATLSQTIQPLVQVPLGPVFVRPVDNRAHLVRLVRYHIRQPVHHELDVHPALFSGSCFQDLVGARHLDGWRALVAELLPRLRLADLLRHVGLPSRDVVPASDDQVRAFGAHRVVRAAATSVAAPPVLSGKSRPVVTARGAAIHLGDAAGLSRSDLAWALDLSPRAVRRIASRSVDPAAVDAIRIRLGLEAACAREMIRLAAAAKPA